MFNEGDYLTVMSFFHKAQLILDCKLTLESVPETNQYLAMRVTFFFAQGNDGDLWWYVNVLPILVLANNPHGCRRSELFIPLYWPITLMAVYVLSCVFPCTGQ